MQVAVVVSTYWGQHYSGVAAATVDNIEDVEEGMVFEKTFDVEVVERVDYGETGSLDGNSSIHETKNLVGVVAMVAEPRGSRS